SPHLVHALLRSAASRLAPCYLALCILFLPHTASPEIYTLSLPRRSSDLGHRQAGGFEENVEEQDVHDDRAEQRQTQRNASNQKRSEEHSLNSSHGSISYAVFCLKKKNKTKRRTSRSASRTRRERSASSAR